MARVPRDATRFFTTTVRRTGGLPDGVPCTLAGIIEHTRATALFYLHPAEAMFGHGPGCPIGRWLWDFADRLAADGLPVAKPGPIPRQRRPSE